MISYRVLGRTSVQHKSIRKTKCCEKQHANADDEMTGAPERGDQLAVGGNQQG
jgi:hypothetical protein